VQIADVKNSKAIEGRWQVIKKQLVPPQEETIGISPSALVKPA
jgi:hypothetical protein